MKLETLKQVGVAIANWLSFLTLPLWGGFFVLWVLVKSAIDDRRLTNTYGDPYYKNQQIEKMTGKRWLLE